MAQSTTLGYRFSLRSLLRHIGLHINTEEDVAKWLDFLGSGP